MKTFTTLALAAALTASFAGATFAQGTMSDSDKAMMTKCKAMSESAMKADKGCMDMMKAHPDMVSPASGAKDAPKSR